MDLILFVNLLESMLPTLLWNFFSHQTVLSGGFECIHKNFFFSQTNLKLLLKTSSFEFLKFRQSFLFHSFAVQLLTYSDCENKTCQFCNQIIKLMRFKTKKLLLSCFSWYIYITLFLFTLLKKKKRKKIVDIKPMIMKCVA